LAHSSDDYPESFKIKKRAEVHVFHFSSLILKGLEYLYRMYLSGTNAAGTYFQSDMGSIDNGSYLFKIGSPRPVAPPVRVAHGITEKFTLITYITNSCHEIHLL